MPAPDPADLSARYLRAQLEGNRTEAIRVLVNDGLAAGLPVAVLLIDVVQRSQREIGRLWQENAISVADEHLATAISQLAMARLFQEAPIKRANGKTVLFACVEGEFHDMGIRVASDLLEIDGFEVKCLGANVPTDSLVAWINRNHPDVVGLSATMTFNLPALRTAVARLRAECGGGFAIVAGGHAFEWSPDAVAGAAVTMHSTSELEMVRDVRRAVGL